MARPASPSDGGVQDSVGTDPRLLMAQEFLVLTAFIAGLLDDLTDAPPDWRAVDTRIETLQLLATVGDSKGATRARSGSEPDGHRRNAGRTGRSRPPNRILIKPQLTSSRCGCASGGLERDAELVAGLADLVGRLEQAERRGCVADPFACPRGTSASPGVVVPLSDRAYAHRQLAWPSWPSEDASTG